MVFRSSRQSRLTVATMFLESMTRMDEDMVTYWWEGGWREKIEW